jgi:Domain of unknown function (DUF1877)
MSLIGHAYLLSDDGALALLSDPTTLPQVVDRAYNEPSAGFVDMDKAWHCLHYLLTGEVEGGQPPLDFILHGGRPVGSEDWGRGPARVLFAREVAPIADALAALDAGRLLPRFRPLELEMLGLYPGGFAELDPSSDYDLGYYFGPFEELRRVTARAKAEGLGMLVWIA